MTHKFPDCCNIAAQIRKHGKVVHWIEEIPLEAQRELDPGFDRESVNLDVADDASFSCPVDIGTCDGSSYIRYTDSDIIIELRSSLNAGFEMLCGTLISTLGFE